MKAIQENDSSWMFWRKRRYLITFLAFCGYFTSYILRVNLSVAIVKMTQNRTIIDSNGTISYFKEFDWNSRQQGLVLSSFFYGYITTQLFGGWLAARIGGKRVFGYGIGITAFLTIVTPPITRCSLYLLIAVRVLEGVCEGVTYPSISALWANWAPPLERSKISALAFAGCYIGTVFAMPVCGIMADRLDWSSIFYCFGSAGLLWFICWMKIVKDRPEDDPHISESELAYIKMTLGTNDRKQKISHPWKAMLTTPAAWAIVVVHVSDTWGLTTMITQLPTYMNDVLNFKLEKVGMYSALPYLLMAIMLSTSGLLADYFRSKNILTTTQARKICACGASLVQAIFMVCTAYITTPIAAIICITIAGGFGGMVLCAFSVNYLDIASRHASVLMGIGNTFGTLPGIISPIVTGYIVQHKKPEEWRVVFLIAATIYLIGGTVYLIWASGEEQPWAKDIKEKDKSADYDNPGLEIEV